MYFAINYHLRVIERQVGPTLKIGNPWEWNTFYLCNYFSFFNYFYQLPLARDRETSGGHPRNGKSMGMDLPLIYIMIFLEKYFTKLIYSSFLITFWLQNLSCVNISGESGLLEGPSASAEIMLNLFHGKFISEIPNYNSFKSCTKTNLHLEAAS